MIKLLKDFTMIEWLIIAAIIGILAAAAVGFVGGDRTIKTGELCARPPKFTTVSTAADRVGLVITGLDTDGVVWVKIDDGCWREQ